ncbi:MAG: hypothetical protein NTV97_34670 [Alphaproteobacteria bacterium]|nr:hypothetical protein [Alphaproteobacteria bacterium]
MAALRLLLLIVSLASAFASADLCAQTRPVEGEQATYATALANKDAAKRAQALEAFLSWYPASPLRVEAFEQMMAAWQSAGNPARADAAASRLLQIDADNIRALANRVYVGRNKAVASDAAAFAPIVAAAERGLAALAKWSKPAGVSDADFARLKQQTAAIFNGALGAAAIQAKDYAKARRHYADTVSMDPDGLQDIYNFSVAQLEGAPIDALGFWYAARAIVIARGTKNETAAASIDRYARSRYQRYHGSEEGWEELVAKVAAGQRTPPADFVLSISRAQTAAEAAIQAVADADPATLSFSDWEFVLSHRDASPANRAAADRVWNVIVEKQKGGGARLKIPVKVISATPDRIEAAITDENQATNTADLEAKMSRPLTPLPAVGAMISIVGSINDYRPRPFLFRMTGAELAQESLPVAGGPCAEPRPQLCTRDYRPACGLRRDSSRRTYGNACSACADPAVLSQAAGACP